MKHLYFVIFAIIHLLIATYTSRDLTNLVFVTPAFTIILFAGFGFYFHPGIKNKFVKDLGWGMLYGSILSLFLEVFFIVCMYNSMRGGD
jgi:hypothetical protein